MTPWLVTRSAISRFADALGDDSAACPLVAPPTFAIVPGLRAVEALVTSPEVGLDYRRVVHREQRFVHHRPIHAGDVLTTAATLRDVRSVRGNTVARVDVEITDPVQAPVCSMTTTLVVRERDVVAPPSSVDLHDVELGPVTVLLRQADLPRYAEASGDLNPIHLDPAAAKEAGLPGVIAHGMLTMGQAMRVLVRDPGAVTSCDAVFTHPVVVPADGEVPLVVSGRSSGPDRLEVTVSHQSHRVARVSVAVALDRRRNPA